MVAVRSAGGLAVIGLVAVALAACGSSDPAAGLDTADRDNDQLVHGAELFSRHCSGCHNLAAVGARGSADNPNDRERRDGPNLDSRRVSHADALFAIRNGGFSGKLMPANLVTGDDAEVVAQFVARYAGRQAPPVSPLESPTAAKLPAVPAGSAVSELPAPASGSIGDPTVQRAAFDSAQARSWPYGWGARRRSC